MVTSANDRLRCAKLTPTLRPSQAQIRSSRWWRSPSAWRDLSSRPALTVTALRASPPVQRQYTLLSRGVLPPADKPALSSAPDVIGELARLQIPARWRRAFGRGVLLLKS